MGKDKDPSHHPLRRLANRSNEWARNRKETSVAVTMKEWIESDDGFDTPWEEIEMSLFIQFLEKIGITQKTVVSIEDEKIFPREREIPQEGWSLFINFDDWSVAVYKDGKPIAGQYSSFRGVLHQDGAFIVDYEAIAETDSSLANAMSGGELPGKHWYAHNLPGISGRSMNVNVWEVAHTIDSEIAMEWLLGRGMFAEGDAGEDN